MHKVMTRTNHHHTGTRPPSRRDSRRPGGTPPRTPGGGTTRTTTPGGRPPGSPGAGGTSARTRPADTRPRTAPGTPRTTTTAKTPATTTTPARATATAKTPATTTPTTTPVATATPTAPDRTPRRPLPQPRPTDVFADRLLAVLSGQRPVHCMLRHTAGRAYDELAWLAERGPLRTTRGTLPVVRDIGYEFPRPGAIEAFARIGAGDQLRAMAFRLEQGRDLRWRCTAVELGGPRPPRAYDD
ncbi:Rv3235 family protein [Streptomyces sp. NPDC002838]|uniref:Rv3235 family protein n=1 Tax=Streptomyces sp. NPDC002838 TaxID=3154436 RepID=UPI00332DB235